MEDIKNAEKVEAGGARVLAVGQLGAGKSTQILTLPGRKFVYVFDPNAVESFKGYDIDYIPFIPDIDDLDLSVKTLKKDRFDKSKRDHEPKTYLRWENDWYDRLEGGFFKEYDWLCFDSLTTFSEIIMDRVQYLNKRMNKHPEQADYTAEMNQMRNIFRAATGETGCNLYVTAHVEAMKDESQGKTYFQLLITGKNRVRIPLRFSQIYGMLADTDSKGAAVYEAQTVSDRWYPFLRTSVRDLKPVETVTIDWKQDPIGQGLGRFVTK